MHRFGIILGVSVSVLFCIAAGSRGAPQYNIVALDVLPGGLDSLALGLNDVGQVVGYSLLNRSGNIGQSRPVVWGYSGQPHELWNDQSVGGSLADINNHGEIVGSYGSGSFIPLPTSGVPYGRAFYWTESTGRIDIGLEPVGNSQAIAINDTGRVAGTSERLEYVDIEGTPQPLYIPHAYIWDTVNGIHELGSLGGQFTKAKAMNNLDQIVGYGDLASGYERAFIWDESGGIRELPTPSGGETRARAINDLGQVVGFEFGLGGFIWDQNTGITLMPGLGNPYALNNRGEVVGGGALIWDATNGTRRLADLIESNSAWQLEFAFAINDASDVVGYGLLNGEVRAFLLTPIPEPRASQLGALAAIILAVRTLLFRHGRITNKVTR